VAGNRFPHIYALLRATGHDAALAAKILRDARCNDTHARIWIKTIATSRWSVLPASFPRIRNTPPSIDPASGRYDDPSHRWHAVVNYRSDNGVVDVHHDIDELGEIEQLVERGPDWNTITEITITLQRRNHDMTVEQSLKL
jgi:hypothetical protein